LADSTATTDRASRWLLVLLFSLTSFGESACKKRELLPAGEGPPVVVIPASDAAAVVEVVGVNGLVEQEPNDRLEQAQAFVLDRGTEAIALSGSLAFTAGRYERDTFRFGVAPPIAPGETEAVSVSDLTKAGSPSDAAVEKYDEPAPFRLMVAVQGHQPDVGRFRIEIRSAIDAEILVTSAGLGSVAIPNWSARPGDEIWVQVRAATGKNDGNLDLGYELTARLLPSIPGDEVEPNDTGLTSATSIEPSVTMEISGLLGWRGDVDWFVLDPASIDPAGTLQLNVDLPDKTVASLSVHTADGAQWASAGRARGGLVRLQDVAVPASVASGEPLLVAIENHGRANHTQRYLLRVRNQFAEPSREREPNDDPSKAGFLTGAKSARLPHGDVDVWQPDAAASAVQIVPPPQGALSVRWIDEHGAVLAEAESIREASSIRVPDLPDGEIPGAARYVELRRIGRIRIGAQDAYVIRPENAALERIDQATTP